MPNEGDDIAGYLEIPIDEVKRIKLLPPFRQLWQIYREKHRPLPRLSKQWINSYAFYIKSVFYMIREADHFQVWSSEPKLSPEVWYHEIPAT